LYVGNVLCCTLVPINKWPPSQALHDDGNATGCAKSQPGAPGTMGSNMGGGTHMAPNFRSDHATGANFLYADTSVHFLQETIDLLLYQKMSTMAGGEIAEPPAE
jgi:prepilin-type processing-associated H-X9-DG protein